MRIILTRHCETDWNVEHRLQGHSETPLNNHGREQARELAEKLKKEGITLIYSSNLKRATETADILNKVLRVPIKFDERLREFCFGRLEGKLYPAAERELGSSFEEAFQNKNGFRNFGGENVADVLERESRLIRDIERLQPRETVLLIGHGSSLHTLQNQWATPGDLKRGQYQVVEYLNGVVREVFTYRP